VRHWGSVGGRYWHVHHDQAAFTSVFLTSGDAHILSRGANESAPDDDRLQLCPYFPPGKSQKLTIQARTKSDLLYLCCGHLRTAASVRAKNIFDLDPFGGRCSRNIEQLAERRVR
jgi:hypothetical protein